ncbi:MAG TPA: hypothetical protein VG860_02555 [Terriglobia bacterium]|jgi:hypothetical protein|nr:hypothetical protein [Terriglobia bacterium]
MRPPSEYAKTWQQIFSDRGELAEKRTNLETELSEVKNQISHLDEILSHMAPLVGVAYNQKISALGITDAIRTILRGSMERMSPTDVRDNLRENDFDLSGYTAPMASIYKVLSRLYESGEIVQEREDGKVFYRWYRPDEPSPDELPDEEPIYEGPPEDESSGEITGDDIPF